MADDKQPPTTEIPAAVINMITRVSRMAATEAANTVAVNMAQAAIAEAVAQARIAGEATARLVGDAALERARAGWEAERTAYDHERDEAFKASHRAGEQRHRAQKIANAQGQLANTYASEVNELIEFLNELLELSLDVSSKLAAHQRGEKVLELTDSGVKLGRLVAGIGATVQANAAKWAPDRARLLDMIEGREDQDDADETDLAGEDPADYLDDDELAAGEAAEGGS